MKRIVLKQKTGFQTRLPFVILDERKITFYTSDFTNSIKNGETLSFNLPKGVYYYNGSFLKLEKPVQFKEISLPPRERNFEKVKYKIIYSKNPNKCTVNHLNSTITFDNAFRKAPEYIIADIFYHEIGHRYYSTEEYADKYATKKMLEIGYNPSQIGRSSILSLRKENIDRKVEKVETIMKLKNG